jgi:peptidoglycan/LPS O-acetylase OafA/YrhL
MNASPSAPSARSRGSSAFSQAPVRSCDSAAQTAEPQATSDNPSVFRRWCRGTIERRKNEISQETSERLALLRFPLMVAVLFHHAGVAIYSGQDGASTGGGGGGLLLLDFIRSFVQKTCDLLAVPCFFLMSGFLFFWGFSWSLKNYKKKLTSRVRTLLIPLLFWSNLVLLGYFILQQMPLMRGLFTGRRGIVSEFGIFEYFNALVGITQHPYAFQLWFLRDLFLLTLVSPLIYFGVKKIPYLWCPLFVACYVFDIWFLSALEIRSVAFFTIGAFLAVSGRSPFLLDRSGIFAAIVFCVCMVFDFFNHSINLSLLTRNVEVFSIVVFALFISGKIVKYKKMKNLFLLLANFSFFLFVFHEPLLSFATRLFFKFFPIKSELLLLGFYFATVFFITALSFGVYLLLKKLVPGWLNFITGGRARPATGRRL